MKPMRLHHVGIVLPTLEKAHEFMQNNGLEIDYAGYVDAYQADLIFTKFGEFASPIEMIIPHSGVLTQFNGGRGGIAHIAFEVDDVEAVRQEMEADCPGCMLEKKAVQGTDDIIVNFRRPTTNQGILVEYVQTTAPITGRGENPFVKNLGPEKGKLNETWHPMRLHHIGIVLPTLEKAHEFIKTNGLEVDYSGFVDAYHADLIFTKKGENSTPINSLFPVKGSSKISIMAGEVSLISPLKWMMSKRYVRLWKARSLVACSKRKPSGERTISSSTSAVPARTPASSSNMSRP